MPRNTVLVVEDDALLRLDAVTVLREAGLDVVEFNNADDALAFAWDRPTEVAAIFTDIQMPGHLGGLELAEIVARHWPRILVLITSGHVRPIEPIRGNVRFVPKPWLPLDVLTAIQGAVEASAAGAAH